MHILLTHQAVAEFLARNFEQTAKLLHQAFQKLEIEDLYLSDASFNAICDAIEIVELMYENLPVLEPTTYAQEAITQLKTAVEKGGIDLPTFQKNILDFEILLCGLRIGLDFFCNNNLQLENPQTPLSFGVEKEDFIQLYQLKNTLETARLIELFNDCFIQKKEKNLAEYQSEIAALLSDSQVDSFIKAKKLLEEMMQQFPQSQRAAFLQLANLYFEQKDYRAAVDAYMKSIVMGTPKNGLKNNIQIACNSLAANASSKDEVKHWRTFLAEFF